MAAGDSLSFDDAEALAESQADADEVLRRAEPCQACGGRFDPLAQYVNYPGEPCEVCEGAGWTTSIFGLHTAASCTSERT
jgi:hypothetical protein